MSLASLVQHTTHVSHSVVAEFAAAFTMLAQSVITFFVLAYAPDSRMELLEWILIPLLGAMFASVGAFCLNTQTELRKVVIGRCFCALVVGLVGPRFLFVWWASAAALLADPFLKLGAGFIFGSVTYVLSYFAFIGFYARAPAIAEQALQNAEEHLVGKISDKMAADAAKVAVGVAEKLAQQPDQSPAAVAEAIASVAKNPPN